MHASMHPGPIHSFIQKKSDYASYKKNIQLTTQVLLQIMLLWKTVTYHKITIQDKTVSKNG